MNEIPDELIRNVLAWADYSPTRRVCAQWRSQYDATHVMELREMCINRRAAEQTTLWVFKSLDVALASFSTTLLQACYGIAARCGPLEMLCQVFIQPRPVVSPWKSIVIKQPFLPAEKWLFLVPVLVQGKQGGKLAVSVSHAEDSDGDSQDAVDTCSDHVGPTTDFLLRLLTTDRRRVQIYSHT
ncbi:hypothetical protein DIPPA_32759 [Diplonema papillatum]|nr:hypothetical protein DIPPA_32759 [Diplonema papillatum]